MDEFLKALSMIEEFVPEPLEYRLHYDDQGNIVMCSMQGHPESTQYLVVDRDTYDTYFSYYVKDGKLVKIESSIKYSVPLKKSTTGYPVASKNASILIEESENYTDIEYYESNN